MMRCVITLCIALAITTVACEEPLASDPVERGKQLYRRLDCARCHQIAGVGARIGPELTAIAQVAERRRPGAAEDYIRQSLLEPGAYVVPGFPDTMPRALTTGLPESDVDALVAYLLTLR